jgi:hypothetical protein
MMPNTSGSKDGHWSVWLTATAVAVVTVVVGCLLYYRLMHLPEALNLWAVLTTLVIVVRYTAVTTAMGVATRALAVESIKQRRALVAPCVLVKFGGFDAQHHELTVNVFNFSEENIALDFRGQLYVGDEKVAETTREIVAYCESHSMTHAGPTSLRFNADNACDGCSDLFSQGEVFNVRAGLGFRYTYSDKTGEFCYEGVIRHPAVP